MARFLLLIISSSHFYIDTSLQGLFGLWIPTCLQRTSSPHIGTRYALSRSISYIYISTILMIFLFLQLCSRTWRATRPSFACSVIQSKLFPVHTESTHILPQLREVAVLPRTRVHELLQEQDTAQHHIDDWLKDERGDNTAQIVVLAPGLLRFLWFSIRDIGDRQKKEVDDLGRLVMDNVPAALQAAVEIGDSKLSLILMWLGVFAT